MEKIGKEKKKRLDSRDLITIGIFSAIYIVIYIIVGMLLYTVVSMLGPIFMLIASGIISVMQGTVVILLASKVKKMGVFLILAIIFGLVMMIMGYWWNMLIYIVFGLVAELIASKGQYNNKINLALAFCIFQWGVVFANYLLYYLFFRESYIQIMFDMGLSLQEAQEHVAILFSTEVLIIVIISNIIGQVLGAYIGLKVNKKHFETAGMI